VKLQAEKSALPSPISPFPEAVQGVAEQARHRPVHQLQMAATTLRESHSCLVRGAGPPISDSAGASAGDQGAVKAGRSLRGDQRKANLLAFG
jgi:hypothetical protein